MIGNNGISNNSSNNAHASSASVNFSIEAAEILNLTLSSSTISLDLSPTSEGTFSSSDNLIVTVDSNNETGYTLSMETTSTNLNRSTDLSDGTTSVIPTLSYNTTGYTSSAFPTNAWGYTLNGGSNNPIYNPVAYSNIIKRTSTNNTNSESDTVTTLNFATKLDNNVPSGTYTTTLTFYAISNYVSPSTGCPMGNICYNPNGADGTLGMANQTNPNGTIIANNSDITLRASNFSRNGYGFAGWMTTPTYIDGTTITYGPNQTINVGNINTTNGLTLYARWIASTGSMQDFTSSQCNNLTPVAVTGTGSSAVLQATNNTITALTDTRDGNVYTIARLADGKCWMIENLRLGDGAILTAQNTDNPALSIVNERNQSTGDIVSSSNHLSPTSSDWCTTQNAACYDQSILNTDNITQTPGVQLSTDTNAYVYSYGNYYNWYSATAGTGTYSTQSINPDSATGAIYINATGSICPNGWGLPVGGPYPSAGLADPSGEDRYTEGNNSNNSDFYQLTFNSLGDVVPDQRNQQGQAFYSRNTGANKILRSFPNNFIYSGYRFGLGIDARGTIGYYWSPTASSAINAYNLDFNNNLDVRPGTSGNIGKYNGFPVRCLIGN